MTEGRWGSRPSWTWLRWPVLCLVAVLCVQCSSSVSEPSVPAWRLAQADVPFLVNPLDGFDGAVEDASRSLLQQGHRDLLAGSLEGAKRAASELLEKDAALAPGLVLQAQVLFASSDYRGVADQLTSLVAETEGYRAAALVLGRSLEALGELPEAFEVFSGVEDPAADQRARALRPRAVEIVANRIDASLGRGDVSTAQAQLEKLRLWAPDQEDTARSWLSVAQALGEPVNELAAMRSLGRFGDDSLGFQSRRAELELEVGDPGAALRLYQELSGRFPTDGEVAEGLAQASFLWRMKLLPEGVQGIYRRPELSRGDFAALLFWLFPDVRYGEAQRGTIATDVLEHDFRDEIVKVVNLNLLGVDPGLHKFYPDRAIERVEAMRGLLQVMNRGKSTSCLGSSGVPGEGAHDKVCQLASQCRVLPADAACLPTAPMSGEEAISLSRRAQEALEQK